MQLSVTATVEAVYPFGEQESFVISNKGPWTIYVDQDSSVSQTNSHPIPPTGTMVWDALRPLFMVASADAAGNGSVVTIVRNSQASVFTNQVDSTLYDANYSGNAFTTPYIECSAYQNLLFRVANTAMEIKAGHLTMTDYTYLNLQWYDRDRNIIGRTPVQLPPAWGNSLDPLAYSRATVPVRGAFVTAQLLNTKGLGTTFLKIVGSTRNLAPGMAAGYYDSHIWCVQDTTLPQTGAFDGSAVLDFPGTYNPTLYIPNLGTRLDITWREAVVGAGNGSMGFTSALDANAYYQFFGAGVPGGVAIASFGVYTLSLPLFECLALTCVLRAVRTVLSFRWYDE